MSYSQTANELATRILDLIPTNPQILKMDSPWDLGKIQGFHCNDLGPTLFQAQWALAKAKQLYKEKIDGEN